MRKIITFFFLIYLIYPIFGQLASDNAGNYTTWSNGDNAGNGFTTWVFSNSGAAGQFIASSAGQGFGDINVSSKSFGMYGNPFGANEAKSIRNFNYSSSYSELQDGHTFSAKLAIAFRNGYKGMVLRSGTSDVFRFQAASDKYEKRELLGSYDDLGWSYSQTSIFTVEITQVNGTQVYVRISRGSDIYTSSLINAGGRIDEVEFYVGSTEVGNDLNNLFFNSLEIRSDSPLPVELTSFSALSQSNTVNLTWETATEVNNYGFEIERTITNSKLQIPNWENVGFVEGHGNSNSAKQYSYVDNSVRAGQSYSYRLKQIDFDGQFEYSSVVNVEVGVPMEFSLAQNYPNPFNPSTIIDYSIPSNEFVTIKVFDVLGNTVSTLVNETKEAGKYNATFDANNLTSGIYFYSINAGGFTQVMKMMLVK